MKDPHSEYTQRCVLALRRTTFNTSNGMTKLQNGGNGQQ